MRQKRDALAAKAELLKGLEAEIVGEIPEDELETKIENQNRERRRDPGTHRVDYNWTG